jgi:hypothetical protein
MRSSVQSVHRRLIDDGDKQRHLNFQIEHQ